MGMISTKYDIGNKLTIKTPGIEAEVIAIIYTGFHMTYRCVYWQQGVAFFYEAYDYEVCGVEEEDEDHDTEGVGL